jgi:hypothetical protein
MNPILFLLLLMFGGVAFAQDEGAPEAEATEEAAPADEPKADEEAPPAEGDAEGEEGDEAPAEDGDKKEELPPVEVPASDEEAIGDVQDAVGALQTGQWATFAILLLGLLVFAYNKFIGSKKADAKSE